MPPFSPQSAKVEALRAIAEVLVQIAGELTQIRGALERPSTAAPLAVLRNDPRLDPQLRDALDDILQSDPTGGGPCD